MENNGGDGGEDADNGGSDEDAENDVGGEGAENGGDGADPKDGAEPEAGGGGGQSGTPKAVGDAPSRLGMVIFGKVPCEKWFKQGEIHYKSEVLWYQMKAKRSHFHYISPYNSIPCCLADNDALKICNFAENCRKMHFGCCHGNLISLTYCFVSDRSRLWWSTLPESFKYFDRLFLIFKGQKGIPGFFVTWAICIWYDEMFHHNMFWFLSLRKF